MTPTPEDQRSRRQRSWRRVMASLPPLAGQTVLDLGCNVGEQSAELVALGARVIGYDLNEDALAVARARDLPGAEFLVADLKSPLATGRQVDGIWASFAAAYFTDLPSALTNWSRDLRPGGWIALLEIDDFFGHEPIEPRTRELLTAYAAEGLAAGRYDFHMGRKLGAALEQAGFAVSEVLTLEDEDLAFDGPALPEVVATWRNRFDRMKLLHELCGPEYEAVRDDFLACLGRPDHRSLAKVYAAIATKPA